MQEPLIELIAIYKPNGRDWMDFQITKKNPYSYHHIKKKSDGGQMSFENGAILSKKSQMLLHWLEVKYPLIYLDWEELFYQIHQVPEIEIFQSRIKELKRESLEKRYQK